MEYVWGFGGLGLLGLLIWGTARTLHTRQEADDRRYSGSDGGPPGTGATL